MNVLIDHPSAGDVLGPFCAAMRILAILSFGGMMVGLAAPWRYRVCGALLLGWAAGGNVLMVAADLPVALASELALGAAIGIGAGSVLIGPKLAGELLDDRLRLNEATGEGLTECPEPAGPCVRLLSGLGVVLVVFGGGSEMPVLEGMLSSFRTVPAGQAIAVWDSWRGVSQLLGAALEMAIRTALPVLGAVTIVDWCQVLAARAAPTAPTALAATAVKPLLGLAILVATFGGACESAVAALQVCLSGEWAG